MTCTAQRGKSDSCRGTAQRLVHRNNQENNAFDGIDVVPRSAPAFADWDGDGDVDLVVRAEDGSTRPQGRGGKGRIDIKTNERNGAVVTIRPVADGEGVVFVTLNGQLIRTDVDQISRMGRNTQGVRVVRLRDNDSLISMARVPTDD